jgi:hypothetical protein
MSSTFAEPCSTNPHVASLQETIANDQAKVDCLIIAHNDPQMIQLLADAMEEESVVVLPLCQAEWDTNLSQVLAWAVDAGINHILIAGHSDCVSSAPPKRLKHGQTISHSEWLFPSTDRILAGVSRCQQQLDAAKSHFANQLSNVLKSDELQNKECSDDFSLQTLFYISNGGAFLKYSVCDGTFNPLVRS